MGQKAPAANTPNDELTCVRQAWVGYENELQRDKRTVGASCRRRKFAQYE